MGLLCKFNVGYWGIPFVTPIYGTPVNYSYAGQVFAASVISGTHSLVPVRTGYLRDSISVNFNINTFEARVDAPYAEYVEFGTWKQIPQPFFVTPVQIAAQEIMPLCLQSYNEATRIECEMKAAELYQAMCTEARQVLPYEVYYGILTSLLNSYLLGMEDILNRKVDIKNISSFGQSTGKKDSGVKYIQHKRHAQFSVGGLQFIDTPHGIQLTPLSWQATQPMWREGTVMYKTQKEKARTAKKVINSINTRGYYTSPQGVTFRKEKGKYGVYSESKNLNLAQEKMLFKAAYGPSETKTKGPKLKQGANFIGKLLIQAAAPQFQLLQFLIQVTMDEDKKEKYIEKYEDAYNGLVDLGHNIQNSILTPIQTGLSNLVDSVVSIIQI